MVEVLYVLRFQVMIDGRAIPAAQVPLLARRRLAAFRPQEGDSVPDLPASLVGASVMELDDSLREGLLVLRSTAWVPGQITSMRTPGAVLSRGAVELRASGKAWVDARIAEAEQLGWEQVATESQVLLPADFVVRTGFGGSSPVSVEQEGGPQVLALTHIRDEAVVVGVRRDDHGRTYWSRWAGTRSKHLGQTTRRRLHRARADGCRTRALLLTRTRLCAGCGRWTQAIAWAG